MDLTVGSLTFLPAQISAVNPILVMLIIPFLLYGVFPFLEKRGIAVTPLRRMGFGMGLAALSFVATAIVQSWIDAGQTPSVLWQLPQYVILTLSEVLVSSTGLEFSYSQSPRRMKSTVLGLWNLQVALGNVVAAMMIGSAPLSANLFWVFAGAMAVFGAGFILRTRYYTYRDYPQE
jgi:POT family proton-dependent oligopeptide transporter